MEPDGRMKFSQLISTQQQFVSHSWTKKCLCGRFRIQVWAYETLVEPNTKEGHFGKTGLHPHGRLWVLTPDPDIAPPSAIAWFGLDPATCNICQKTWKESHSLMPQITDPTSVPAVDSEAACDQAATLHSCGSGAVLPRQGSNERYAHPCPQRQTHQPWSDLNPKAVLLLGFRLFRHKINKE